MAKCLLSETTEQALEREALDRKVELDWSRLIILLDISYEHYISVDTKPDLAAFCRMIVTIGGDFEDHLSSSLPGKGVNRLLGETISKAVQFDLTRALPGQTKVSNKSVFKSLVKGLVKKASENGHSKNKISQTRELTAFVVVSDLLHKYGITNNGVKYSPATISNWCDNVK